MTAQISTFGACVGTSGHSNTGVRADAQERQLAWQREMERAQLSNWFKPDAALREGAAAPAAPSRERGVHPQQGGVQERRPSVPVRQASIPNVPPRVFSIGASAGVTHAATWVPAARLFVSAEVSPSSEACEIPGLYGVRPAAPSVTGRPRLVDPAHAPPALSTISSEPRPVLRLHAEPGPDGKVVWVAIRANDEAMRAMLPGVIADLQRTLRERGERLQAVICNGRPVWRDGIALAHDNNVFDSFQTREI